jgi:hypothetical protein
VTFLLSRGEAMDGLSKKSAFAEGVADEQSGSVDQPPNDRFSQTTGWFRFYFSDDRWVWSPEVERLHGYRAGTVAPKTAMVLSHVHPEDYEQVKTTLQQVRDTGLAFSSRHRIVDAYFSVHQVMLVGAPFYDSRGALMGTQGVYKHLATATAPEFPARHEHFDRVVKRLHLVATKGYSPALRRRSRLATRC